eukprot:1080715-Amphidinium_carterae.1
MVPAFAQPRAVPLKSFYAASNQITSEDPGTKPDPDDPESRNVGYNLQTQCVGNGSSNGFPFFVCCDRDPKSRNHHHLILQTFVMLLRAGWGGCPTDKPLTLRKKCRFAMYHIIEVGSRENE